MSNILKYKGYYAKVEYSVEDNVLYGKIEDVSDLVNFECEDVSEIKKVFEETVDDYLEFCHEVGKNPDKAYKGSFNVRISPALHKQIASSAYKENVSLNQYVENALQEFVHKGIITTDNRKQAIS